MKLSALMAVHAKERPVFFKQALLSLEAQEVRADQLVLVEDGPLPKELLAIIAAFRDVLSIVSVRLERNLGLGAALNEGLMRCEYELIARVDSDDINLPCRFVAQLDMFRRDPELDIAGTAAIEIDEDDKKVAIRSVPLTHEAIMADMWKCPLIHPSVMFRKARLMQVGGYSTSLRRRQDYELWFRCANNGFRFGNIAEPLILYRFGAGTFQRQSWRSAWTQGVVGFRGSTVLGLAQWKRWACFFPFFRSLLPHPLNQTLYRIGKRGRPFAGDS